MINNANLLRFDTVNPLQQFVYQQHINHLIGVDLSMGMEYRPYLNNNVIFKAGISTLLPGQGFRDLFSQRGGRTNALGAGFLEAVLTY